MNSNLKPLVSVIINCFNGDKYVREAIDSVIAQTYDNWELIFWDNQSTDLTAELVKSYKDVRIKYIYAPVHTLLGEARNLAIKYAKGDLVNFLDSDDIWDISFLDIVVTKYLEDTRLGLIYCDYVPFGNTNISHVSSSEGVKSFNSLLEHYDIGMSSASINRSVLSECQIRFNNNYQLIEDFDFFLNVARYLKVYHIKKNLVKYRVYSNSLSNTYNFWHLEILNLYNSLLSILTIEEKKECKKGLHRVYQMYLDRCYLDAYFSGDTLLALKNLLKTNYPLCKKIKFGLKTVVGYNNICNIKKLIKFNIGYLM